MKKLNMREARRDLAGVKPTPKPEETPNDEPKVSPALQYHTGGILTPEVLEALRNDVSISMAGHMGSLLDDFLLNGGESARDRIVGLEPISRRFSGGGTSIQQIPRGRLQATQPEIRIEPIRLTNCAITERDLQDLAREHAPRITMDLAGGTDETIAASIQRSAARAQVNRISTGSRIGRAQDALNEFARTMRGASAVLTAQVNPSRTLATDPRTASLLEQFGPKSRAALQREGIDPDGPRPGMHRVEPDRATVQRLLETEGPHHIVRIDHIVYWGLGQRRTCIMECEMDTRVPHRGGETNRAVVAFKVDDPRNHGIQPFCGSQQYNETVGFFIYNAGRGGRL